VVSCWIYAGWVVSPGGGPALIGSNECIADRSSARCEREERAPPVWEQPALPGSAVRGCCPGDKMDPDDRCQIVLAYPSCAWAGLNQSRPGRAGGYFSLTTNAWPWPELSV
jgi:hypothetical protein